MIPHFKKYEEAWNIASKNEISLGLEAIKRALEEVGNPERAVSTYHIAGTNGKGSTTTWLASLLQMHGYTVGTFTSPAIVDVHDQIQINGQPLTKNEMDALFEQLPKTLDGQLTEFELLTVLAFLAFRTHDVDFAVVETGLGGRGDSTNVIDPIASIITTIELDHESILGNTEALIAKEKAGILKNKRPAIIGEVSEEAWTVIQEEARRVGARTKRFGKDFVALRRNKEEAYKGQSLYKWHHRRFEGFHQLHNATLAIAACEATNIPLVEDRIQEVMERVTMPHRFEKVDDNLYLDGAHNVAAAVALVETIRMKWGEEARIDFYVGMLARKNVPAFIETIRPVAHTITPILFNHRESMTEKEWSTLCERQPIQLKKLQEKMAISNQKYPVIVCGSLYMLEQLYIEG